VAPVELAGVARRVIERHPDLPYPDALTGSLPVVQHLPDLPRQAVAPIGLG
jgi:hypothetical protein